jgi:hypothetical protein
MDQAVRYFEALAGRGNPGVQPQIRGERKPEEERKPKRKSRRI